MLDKFFKTIEKITPKKYRWILSHEGFRRYFANTGWMFFGQMFSLVVAFFVGAYVARYLGPKNFGLMNYAISFVGLFGFLAGFGVDNILSRELVKFPDKRDELLGTSFWLKFIGGFLAIAVVNIVSFCLNNDSLTRVLILVFSVTFIFQSFNTVNIFFQSQVLSKKGVKVQIINNLLSALLKIIFIYLNLGVIWIIFLYVVDSINLAVGYIWVYFNKEKRKLPFKIDRKLLINLLKDSLPLMFSVIALTIYGKIDQVIIKEMLNATAVGIYAVAVKLSECWYFIPGLICGSLLPAIVNAKKTDNQSYKKRMSLLYALLIYLGLGMSFVIFIFSKPIIILLFGESYISAIKVSQIYAWSGVSVFLMSGFWSYLLSENYTKIYLIATVIGAISNIILNIFLIPSYGIIGSAYATLISYMTPPLSLLLFKKTRGQVILAFRSIFIF